MHSSFWEHLKQHVPDRSGPGQLLYHKLRSLFRPQMTTVLVKMKIHIVIGDIMVLLPKV